MMVNPKTTISGYVAIVGAILTLVAKVLQGDTINPDEMILIGSAISAGVSGINAKDGRA